MAGRAGLDLKFLDFLHGPSGPAGRVRASYGPNPLFYAVFFLKKIAVLD